MENGKVSRRLDETARERMSVHLQNAQRHAMHVRIVLAVIREAFVSRLGSPWLIGEPARDDGAEIPERPGGGQLALETLVEGPAPHGRPDAGKIRLAVFSARSGRRQIGRSIWLAGNS